MARSARAFALLVAIGWIGGWLTSGPAATDPARRPLAVTVPATTTTVAPTTTSQPPDPPPSARIRASRGETHRSPPRIAPEPLSASSAGDCNAFGWRRTRADLDRCWRAELERWSDWPVEWMAAIMWCESRGDPWAKNPRSSAAGLFQILGASQGDGPGNIAVAHQMWTQRGTAPWRACGG